jgi:hypothetical protein
MDTSTLIIVGGVALVVLFVFRSMAMRLIIVAAMLGSAYWFYSSHGGDLNGMTTSLYMAGTGITDYIDNISSDLNLLNSGASFGSI